jgi:hypothetical protein
MHWCPEETALVTGSLGLLWLGLEQAWYWLFAKLWRKVRDGETERSEEEASERGTDSTTETSCPCAAVEQSTGED